MFGDLNSSPVVYFCAGYPRLAMRIQLAEGPNTFSRSKEPEDMGERWSAGNRREVDGDDENLLETKILSGNFRCKFSANFAVDDEHLRDISNLSNGPFSSIFHDYVDLPGVFDYFKTPGTSDIRNK